MVSNKALLSAVFALVVLNIAGEEVSSPSFSLLDNDSEASSSSPGVPLMSSSGVPSNTSDAPSMSVKTEAVVISEASAETPTRPPSSIAGEVAASSQPPLVHSTPRADVGTSAETPTNASSQVDPKKSAATAVSFRTTLLVSAMFSSVLVAFL